MTRFLKGEIDPKRFPCRGPYQSNLTVVTAQLEKEVALTESKDPRNRLLGTCLSFPLIMMKREAFAVADIDVPVNRRAKLVQKRVDEWPPAWPAENQSWCVRTARVSCWSRAYTGWKPKHHRLRRGRAQALNGPSVVLAGDVAVVT